jgi:serine protease Do
MYMSTFRYSMLCFFFLISSLSVDASQLTKVVSQVKPGVVGVGLFDALGAQTHQLRGTGFVVGDGSYVVTNYHVVSVELDPKVVQYHIVFAGTGQHPAVHKAEIVASDALHDIAILKIDTALQALKLADDNYLADGSDVALTGFPIGAVLGLYPATHRGIVAALTPDVIPSVNSNQLTMNLLKRLDTPFLVYQLDITAYPGNSGSPVYNLENGEVIAILNKVFIKESKETVLEKPSGISYAIPIKYLRQLAASNNIRLN